MAASRLQPYARVSTSRRAVGGLCRLPLLETLKSVRSSIGTGFGTRRASQLLAVVGLSALLALLVWRIAHQNSPPNTGGPAPNFALPYLSSAGDLHLTSLRGDPVVLSFWASWCEPCKAEAGTLERLSRHYAIQGVRFVGVDTNDVASDARRFVRAHGLTYTMVLDENGDVAANKYDVANLPSMFFIDRRGRLVAGNLLGPVTNSARAELFRKYLQLAMRS